MGQCETQSGNLEKGDHLEGPDVDMPKILQILLNKMRGKNPINLIISIQCLYKTVN